jgi:hypothetical protein
VRQAARLSGMPNKRLEAMLRAIEGARVRSNTRLMD